MEQKSLNNPVYTFSLHAFFFALLVLAVWLFRERLLMDSSYYIFHVINNESFCIEHDRYVLALSQILPLIGVKLGISLKSILILYSIGHVLFFYALFVITFYFLKDRSSGYALLAFQTIGILHGFFVPMFELYYGAGLLILFNSVLRKCSWRLSVIILLGLLEMLILLSHPMAFAIFAFIILFHLLDDNRDYRYYLFFLILFIGSFIFKSIHLSPYEQSKSETLISHSGVFLNFQFLIDLLKYLVNGYWEALIFFLMGSVYYISQLRFKKLALIWSFFLGIVFVINSSYDGLVTGRYMEQVYFPLVFVSIIPFAFDVLPKRGLKMRGLLFFVFIVIIAWRILLLNRVADEIFIRRTALLQRLIERGREIGGSKFVIDPFNTTRVYSWGNWSVPVETLLLSAMESKSEAVSIARLEDFENENSKRLLASDRFIFRLNEVFEDASLTPEYFHLRNGDYQLLNQSKLFSEDLKEFRKNISIRVSGKGKYNAGKLEHINVEIQNRNPEPLYSWKKNNLFLTYHWLKNGEVYLWDGIRTPLEVDIDNTYRQDMEVKMPDSKGQYVLIVDLVMENRMWIEINSRIKITIN